MKRLFPLTLVAAFVVAAAAAALLSATAGRYQSVEVTNDNSSNAERTGYVVHVDAKTGEFVEQSPETPAVAFDRDLSNALSTSSEGLKEVDSPGPGGGKMVDLQGRFQHSIVFVTDENGHVTAPCITGPATQSHDHVADEGKE